MNAENESQEKMKRIKMKTRECRNVRTVDFCIEFSEIVHLDHTYAHTHSTIKYNQLAVTVRISLSLSASFSLAVSQQYDFQYGVYAQMEQGVVKRYIEINEKTQ